MSNIITFPHEAALVREPVNGQGRAYGSAQQHAVGDRVAGSRVQISYSRGGGPVANAEGIGHYDVLGRARAASDGYFDPERMATVPYRPGQGRPVDVSERGVVPRASGAVAASGAQSFAPEYRVTSRLRLTRRGRVVIVGFVALVLVAVALCGALFMSGAAVASSTSSPGLTYVTVNAGETLWGLAQELAPQSDPRDVISDILALNRMDSSELEAGQELAIPAQYVGID